MKFGGVLGRLRDRVERDPPQCPETGERRTVQWLRGTPYCSECGQAVEASRRLLRRRFDHPDQQADETGSDAELTPAQ